MDNILISFILTFIAGLSTLIGSLFIFIKGDSKKIIKYALAFASGVMVCVSIIDLLPEAINLLTVHSRGVSFMLVLVFLVIGMLISSLIDYLIPENNKSYDKNLYKIGIFSMIAIIIHNIPEGIATFLSSSTNLSLGITLTIAIALHNIPEGISISVPVYHATKSRKKAILFTFISGMSEPFGALLAFLFLKPIMTDAIMGSLLALIAGIMVHIAMLRLFPTAMKGNNKYSVCVFFFLGIIFMFISHLLMTY